MFRFIDRILSSRWTIWFAALAIGMLLASYALASPNVIYSDDYVAGGKWTYVPSTRPKPRPECVENPPHWRRDVRPCSAVKRRDTSGTRTRPPARERCDRCVDVIDSYERDRNKPNKGARNPEGRKGDGRGRERARERREQYEDCR